MPMPLLPPVKTAIFPANFLDDIVLSFFVGQHCPELCTKWTLYRFRCYCFLSPSIAMVAIDLSSSGDAPALALTLMPVITDRRERAATFESSEERTSFSSFASRISFSRSDFKDDAAVPLIDKTVSSEDPNLQ